ncbi:MAG: TonB-dependent receptor [Salinivirgaceae bacterium]|nr:TonB-dependent receptor [Salinivirgaceae bacterium]
MDRKLIILLLIILKSVSVFSQSGNIKGVLTEELNGKQEPLPFANVFLEGTTTGTTTDFDGNFQFIASSGSYNLICSFMGYETIKKAIEVSEDIEISINVEMKPEGLSIEGVEIVAKVNRESEIALMMEQKNASIIKESIGAKRLSSMGVSDAAAATTKISGVTKSEGSGDVYVRGLGDRYLSTTMNGLPIPSDDIEKKNINLKLFSTDVIENVGISKTYAVDNYVDQTSGNIDITSKTVSENVEIGLSTGTSSNIMSNAVFSDFRATQNANDITFGFYKKPYETIDAIKQQSWNTETRTFPLNYGYSFLGGKDFKLSGKQKLSLFGTLAHSSDFKYYEGVYNKYRMNNKDKLFPFTEEFTTKINTTGLFNLTYKFGDKHTISANALFVAKTEDKLYEAGRTGASEIRDETDKPDDNLTSFVRDQNTKETRMLIGQLHGSHKIAFRNDIKWAVGYNKVNADEPNRIHNEAYIHRDYREFAAVGDAQQKKSHQYIEDKEINGYVKEAFKIIDEGKSQLKLNIGANFRSKTRDFNSKYVGVRARLVHFASIDNMDEVFLNDGLYGVDIFIKEPKPDVYKASLNALAGYMNAGFTFSKFSGNLGFRYEKDQMDVEWNVANYNNPETGITRIGAISNPYNNLLPSVNLKYQLTEKNALRFALSKTLTLPEFKELAPFEYVSQEGDVTKGNEQLINSENYNFDLKWELFPTPKQLISVAAFYKQINDPINLALTRGSSGYFYYANTGKQANVYGFEFEARFDIQKATETGMPKLNLVVNTTKMWHKQDLIEEFQYFDKTESGLQGASEFIFNTALTFSSNSEKELKATLTGNYSSDKIFALGVPESQTNNYELFNDEIIEKGFFTIDLIVSKKLSDRITIKATAKNLLNPKIERTQDVSDLISSVELSPGEFERTYNTRTEIVKSYKKGISLGVGVTINLN